MLIRLLATLPLPNKGVDFARTYLDVGTDYRPDNVAYWQEMAQLNIAIFRREGISLREIVQSAPIVQDLANCLDHVRRKSV